MKSLEKFKLLVHLEKKHAVLKITTIRDEQFICKLRGVAEGEEDWAYHIETLEDEPHLYILECNYIKSIEELTQR